MKIRNRKGFYLGLMTLFLAITCMIIYFIYDSNRYIISTFILLAISIVNFTSAFSKKGILEELTEQNDERDLYLVMKSSHLSCKIMNYTICTLTFLFILLYAVSKDMYFMIIVITLGSILLLMGAVFLGVNIYLEKHE